ncbi:MAG: hypothetical protein VCD00_14155 [Candidatus Hydrogenedentota bacterium]
MRRPRIDEVLKSASLPWVAIAIALLLTLPSLGLGFMADDYMQRAVFLQPEPLDGLFGEPFTDLFTFADGDPERMHEMVDLGIYPWMTNPDLRVSFW